MTAQSVQIFTLDIPNPEWSGYHKYVNLERVASSLGFNYLTSYHLVTLSDSGANSANDVTGLLYTPDLNTTDPCVSASQPWVPDNVTRQANLPSKDYNLIGIAPWISSECTLKYFAAAQQDPIRGFIFFLPDNDTPPRANSATYKLDNSEQWKIQNDWPVYIVPAQTGMIMMNASAAYSGNMTQVPHGNQLAEIYDSTDYIRLFVDINTGSSGDELPTIWIFLLVVLGILAGVVALTSVALHWLNRRRRDALRRRVATGEVDLEALGIKRLIVPQHILDSMPVYNYGTGRSASDADELKEIPSNSEEKDEDSSRPASPRSTTRPQPAVLRLTTSPASMLQQPACAICLDGFVPTTGSDEGTVVRELPCQHIFHPECVDSFLRDSSSLCPICKKSALPIGYCPPTVTNAMVRRERIVRRIRERVSIESIDADDEEFVDDLMYRDTPVSFHRRLRDRTRSSLSHLTGPRRSGSTPTTTTCTTSNYHPTVAEELVEVSGGGGGVRRSLPNTSVSGPSASVGARSSSHPSVQPPLTSSRRMWARQRAEAMLGRRPPPDPDDDEESLRRRSPWQRFLNGVFPL